MSEVGIRALKQNASAVVAQAAGGETVVITEHGRPVAQLTALPASRLQELLDRGDARPARHPLSALPAPDRGPLLSEDLAAMRAAERS